MDLSVDGTGGGEDVHMGPRGCSQAGGPGWEVSGGSLRPSPWGEDSRQSSGQCERSFGAGRSLNGTGPPRRCPDSATCGQHPPAHSCSPHPGRSEDAWELHSPQLVGKGRGLRLFQNSSSPVTVTGAACTTVKTTCPRLLW